MRSLALALVMVVFTSVAALADPTGNFIVAGANPGNDGGKYSGTATVTKTGDTYRVVWVIGDDKFIGTGIGSKDFLAVEYKSGDNTGLALYSEDKDGSWSGVWVYAGGKELGTERWVRK